MQKIKWWSVLGIHLIMGSISLLFYIISFQSLDHAGAAFLSIVMLVVNVIGYLVLSMVLLKKAQRIDVWLSTATFTGIGLIIWGLYIIDPGAATIFYTYHIAGFSSSFWLDQSYGGPFEDVILHGGFLFSLIPSVLIVTGYSVRKKMNDTAWVRLAGYSISAIAALLFVFMTGFRGKRVDNREELASAFPIHTGFPLEFAKLENPTIDPPLPYTYSGSCCTMTVTSPMNYWFSAVVVMFAIILLFEVVWAVKKKKVSASH
ncbi:hypothetical protein LCL89_09380 [Halobacillus yeomjeoni]|uniref:hypothetical protein n=1 Tax=Halobacillus yeomjeoni TaxID=311194 RepID=UPI001CD77AAB|nr:hypothetical protein [Halobacillus yeomjeoni]MCA0984255.1 hypothetical protein [Halobacillus yeomjeoni]